MYVDFEVEVEVEAEAEAVDDMAGPRSSLSAETHYVRSTANFDFIFFKSFSIYLPLTTIEHLCLGTLSSHI